MPDTFTVDGADELERTAHAAADRLAALTALNRTVAGTIAGRVNPPRRTGRLASSITATATPLTAVVSSTLVYAPVQEYGWPARSIRAHRYMATAASVTEPVTVRTYDREVVKIVATVKGA